MSSVPFLKWPGGKRWASELIAERIRSCLSGTYYEPFLGGGAVFFELEPEQAVLSDINADLINTYSVVRDHAEEVVRSLQRLAVERATFERLRASGSRDPLKKAVRFLYLNRTAFGGIYRLNRQGSFNVPYGGGERTPSVLWEKNLLVEAAEVLRGIEIRQADFEEMVDVAGKGDVVYCDPTYTVAHEDNGFIRYNEKNFSWADQIRLATSAVRARRRGAHVLISNAFHQAIRQLYGGTARFTVLVRNSRVSPKVGARREVKELLVEL